jgi:hypothetical protein
MRDGEPTPSANTAQFQAFMDQGGTQPERNPRISTSTIALVSVAVVLVIVAVVAALAL